MKIAISGKMKSGKTTLAWHLERSGPGAGNYAASTYSFADPIRNALREMGIEKSSHPDLYRKGAQYIGTDLCRDYDPDWWVKQMDYRVRPYFGYADSIIIDDMRFQNEYDWAKENGFFIVRLDITPRMQYNRGAEEGTYDHPSETGLDHLREDEWNLWIPENTTVEQRVKMVLSSLRDSPSPSGCLTKES